MQPPQPYPSDLSDARWELIRPTLEAWRQARNGIRKPTHDLRALMNAILYVDRTGIPWRYLPHDFAPWQTVYGYFAAWQKRRHLRPAQRPPTPASPHKPKAGQPSRPPASSTPRASRPPPTCPPTSQGIDAGKKIVGRKRHIVHRHTRPPPRRRGHRRQRLDNAVGIHSCSRTCHSPPHHHQGLGRHRLQDQSHRTRRPPRHRRRSRPPRPRTRGLHTSYPAAGSSNEPSAGSCTTAASPATTKPTPTAPKP